jgi:16S rRNA (cytosine967-C5)-methyltransferase
MEDRISLFTEAIRIILFQKVQPERAFDIVFKKLNFQGDRRSLYLTFLDLLKGFQYVSYVYPELSIREKVIKAINCNYDPLYSFPNWIRERLLPVLGKEGLRKIYNKFHWIRVNTLKADIDKVIKSLEAQGFNPIQDDFPFLFKVDKWYYISRTEEYKLGYIIPQDKAAVLAVKVLDPRPYETIIEIGGAPGVKTSLIQQFTDNKSKVISMDISAKRLKVQEELMKRWNIKNVDLIQADGANLPIIKGDKLFIDAPCSNSGTINTDPSVYMRLTKSELMGLIRLQGRILREASKLKREVVYVTCSLFPEEGEKIVEKYEKYLCKINNNPDMYGYLKSKVWLRVIRTYPHVHGSEGFFIAKLCFGEDSENLLENSCQLRKPLP